jgi:hypothetical protein
MGVSVLQVDCPQASARGAHVLTCTISLTALGCGGVMPRCQSPFRSRQPRKIWCIAFEITPLAKAMNMFKMMT